MFICLTHEFIHKLKLPDFHISLKYSEDFSKIKFNTYLNYCQKDFVQIKYNYPLAITGAYLNLKQ